MDWELILQYEVMIKKIASKYSGNVDLAADVAHEVMIKLFEDKKLDVNKFNPKTRDAAIRNTIRNKTLKVLRSKKIGRWPFDSLEKLQESGYQIDESQEISNPVKNDGRENTWHEDQGFGDNNVLYDEDEVE